MGASWTTLQGAVVGMGLRLKQTASFHPLRRKRGTLENGLLLRYVLRCHQTPPLVTCCDSCIPFLVDLLLSTCPN